MVKRSGAASPPRVVIDTNVLVSTLVFESGAVAALREAWQSGKCAPVVSRATVEELIEVLKYPKFQLSADEQADVLAAYLPYCEVMAEPRTRVELPPCRDEDDMPFLLLAVAAKVDTLITGDGDLLAMKGKVPCDVMSPVEWLRKSGR